MGRSGATQSPRVVLYKAEGCHLCERAKAQLDELRDELGFALVEIAIDRDPELESRYRELIPVVEIDGERVCTYYVQPEPFRRKLAAAQAAAETTGL
ncbi:MAG TPA: glutaredoxin family protein [Gaiellaceae bacterium]